MLELLPKDPVAPRSYKWYFLVIQEVEYACSPTLRRLFVEELQEIYPDWLTEMAQLAVLSGHQVYWPSEHVVPIPLPDKGMWDDEGRELTPVECIRGLMSMAGAAMGVDWEWKCYPCTPIEAAQRWAELSKKRKSPN